MVTGSGSGLQNEQFLQFKHCTCHRLIYTIIKIPSISNTYNAFLRLWRKKALDGKKYGLPTQGICLNNVGTGLIEINQ